MDIKKLNNIYKEYLDNKKLIELNGWVQTLRSQKDYSFITLNDGSTPDYVQLVIDNNKININELKITTGTSINVIGNIVKSPCKGQDFEMQVNELKVYGLCNPENYPLAKSKLPLTYLRNYYHLRFRTNTFGSVFRIKDSIMFATHLFFHENKYLHLDPNILTINECEGGAGVFQVTEKDITNINDLPINKETKKYDWSKDHFMQPVYLTVSSQLQLEAISCSMGAVYTTNKSFRSEHSNTSKHLSEFIHLEIENIFIDLEYLMDISEKYIKYIGNYLLQNNKNDLNKLEKFVSKGIIDKIEKLINNKFIKLEYKDAINLIKEKSEIKIEFGEDLSSECENFLTEYFDNSPVFVTNWTISIKSFYMKQNDDGITCSNFDLLMPYKVGELIGGSMREENYDKLVKMMEIKGVSKEPLEFYLDLRRFGTVPHGGFGLGIDRITMLFTGMENIRDVIPFPNTYQSCKF
jgi:asparaginyl-tRNA synthetase